MPVSQSAPLAQNQDKPNTAQNLSGFYVDGVYYTNSNNANYCLRSKAPKAQMLFAFIYDRSKDAFLMDKNGANIFSLENYHAWIPVNYFYTFINSEDAKRLYLSLHDILMGDIIFERIKIEKGQYQGETFVIQGTIQSRDEEGNALYATGYISHENSPLSELIPRELSQDGRFFWNANTDKVIVSASYCDMLGYSADEFPRTFSEFILKLVHPDDNDITLVQKKLTQSRDYGDYFECCLRLKHKKGHYIWTIGRGLVLERNAKGVATQIIGSQTNIDIVKSNFDNIKLLLFTDSLTGLHNRVFLQSNSVRYESPYFSPLSVIFIDVSGLKLTNDILGHKYGDYLLTKTCDLIRIAILSLNDHDICDDNCFIDSNANTIPTQLNNELLGDIVIPKVDNIKNFSHPKYKNLTNSEYQELHIKENNLCLEIMRLAGDEFLIIYPHANKQQCQVLVDKIELMRSNLNSFHQEFTPINKRPVPLFFGIGSATLSTNHALKIDENSIDSNIHNLEQAINLADLRMQQNKELKRHDNYYELKTFFELKKGRPVSMRDERRLNVFNEKEREVIKAHQISNLIS